MRQISSSAVFRGPFSKTKGFPSTDGYGTNHSGDIGISGWQASYDFILGVLLQEVLATTAWL